MIEALSNPFENLETEYQREQYLEKQEFFIKPLSFIFTHCQCGIEFANRLLSYARLFRC